MTYTVYFELYGKKMKVNIEADSEVDARRRVRDDIRFVKVVRNEDVVDFMMGMFGMKK